MTERLFIEQRMTPIQTKRLVLRPFAQRDAADLYAYMHAPVASCFLSDALADMSAADVAVTRRMTDETCLAVCLRASDLLIGDLFAVPEGDTFSVGWNFNPDFGAVGYAYEATQALFAHLFMNRSARRLYAYVEDTNTSSRKLCEKLGMRQEGVFKEFISFKSDDKGSPIYENTMQYALLRHEWQAKVAGPVSASLR